MKTIVILASLLMSRYGSFAQSFQTWVETPGTPARITSHGNLSISIDKETDDIYVGTISEGIFCSRDNGESWEHSLHEGAMTGKIVIAKLHIYATGIAMIYRSDDQGKNWEALPVPTDHTISDLVVLSTGRVVVSTADFEETSETTSDYLGDGIFISDDLGVTWKHSSDGLLKTKAVMHLAVDSKDRLYAATCSTQPNDNGAGVYFSNDAGKRWTGFNRINYLSGKEAGTINLIYYVNALEVDAHDSIYFSYDGTGGNYHTAGTFKNSFAGAAAEKHWMPVRARKNGWDWDFTPLSSIFFSQEGDQYGSMHAPLSRVMGGPYTKFAGEDRWARSVKGITAPVIGYEFGHRQCEFAQTSAGKVFAIQHNDMKIYMAGARKPTGISEHHETPAMSVYPNPVNNFITVNPAGQWTGRLTCTLFTIEGKAILQQNIVANENIDISTLPNGLYLLTLTSADGQANTRRIAVAHE